MFSDRSREPLGMVALCIMASAVIVAWSPPLLFGALGWLLLAGGMFGALLTVVANRRAGVSVATSVLLISGIALVAALISYGPVLYMHSLLN